MLNTNRLQIRALVSEDWPAIQKIAIDFRKSEYAIYDMPLPVESETVKNLTKQFAESHLFFAVMLDKVMIGYVCFHEENGNYDLGYCFHSDYHGKGYAYEACSVAIEHILKTRDIKALTAGTALINAAVAALQNEGITRVCLNVMESNYDGKRFWTNRGWEKKDFLGFYSKSITDKENLPLFKV